MNEEKTPEEISAMNNLVDSIKLKTGDGHEDKTNVVRYPLTPSQAEEIDVIQRALEMDGRVFSYDEKSGFLTIDSSNCENASK